MYPANSSSDRRQDSCAELASFIRERIASIVQCWSAFPYADQAGSGDAIIATLVPLAEPLLIAVALHMEDSQACAESPSLGVCAERFALAHLSAGLTEAQLVLTMQALRKSVLRLWADKMSQLDTQAIEAIMRLNQTFDNALAAAVDNYCRVRERCHGLFLKTLAHDLRNPLGGLELMSQLLQKNAMFATGGMHKIAASIDSAVSNAVKMAGDIYDFGSIREGFEISISPVELDAAALYAKAIDELASHYPDHRIRFEASGPIMSELDESRVAQAFFNVTAYALHHNVKSEPVSIKLYRDGGFLLFSICYASLMPASEEAEYMFDPMRRYALHLLSKNGPLTALGIDLYLAREIFIAHGGEITAEASGEEMHMTARLPLCMT